MNRAHHQWLFEDRPPVPPWPTSPAEKAELLRAAERCEDGWREAERRRAERQPGRPTSVNYRTIGKGA